MVKTAETENDSASRWLLKLVCGLLLLVLFALQYRLWFADANLVETRKLQQRLDKQQATNQAQQARNNQLAAEIRSLKSDLGEVEARARKELGMVKPDETFFMLVDGDEPAADDSAAPDGR